MQKVTLSTGVTATYNDDGFVTLENTTSSIKYINCYADNKSIEINNDYTLNVEFGTSTKEDVYLQKSNSDYSVVTKVGGSVTNTAIDNYMKALICLKANETTKIRLTLEKGTTATGYVQHQEQDFTIPCQKEMLTEDYFDWDNEEEVHGWKKRVLDGTENWSVASSIVTGTTRFYTNDFTDVQRTGSAYTKHVLSNSFESLSWDEIYATNTTTKNAISDYSYPSDPHSRIVIRIDSTIASTENELKAYLAQQYANGTPVVICYQLEEEEKLPFTQAQKTVSDQIKDTAHSYGEKTHIYSTDAVSPNFDITAVADMNLIIDEISQALVANGGV